MNIAKQQQHTTPAPAPAPAAPRAASSPRTAALRRQPGEPDPHGNPAEQLRASIAETEQMLSQAAAGDPSAQEHIATLRVEEFEQWAQTTAGDDRRLLAELDTLVGKLHEGQERYGPEVARLKEEAAAKAAADAARLRAQRQAEWEQTQKKLLANPATPPVVVQAIPQLAPLSSDSHRTQQQFDTVGKVLDRVVAQGHGDMVRPAIVQWASWVFTADKQGWHPAVPTEAQFPHLLAYAQKGMS